MSNKTKEQIIEALEAIFDFRTDGLVNFLEKAEKMPFDDFRDKFQECLIDNLPDPRKTSFQCNSWEELTNLMENVCKATAWNYTEDGLNRLYRWLFNKNKKD